MADVSACHALHTQQTAELNPPDSQQHLRIHLELSAERAESELLHHQSHNSTDGIVP